VIAVEVRCVYVSENLSDAGLKRNRLEDEGIRAQIVGDALPYVGTGAVGRVEVWAEEQDADRAEQLLMEWNVKSRASEQRPGRFQFSLFGLLLVPTAVAVALGTALDPDGSQILWGAVGLLFWGTIFVATMRRWHGRTTQDGQSPDRRGPSGGSEAEG
jgi:hypothetical protein